MTDNYKIFMEAISQLGLTPAQLEATSNLYKITMNRPKINGENIGDIINEVNERMDAYAYFLQLQHPTDEELHDELNKKWMEVRDHYKLREPENDWYKVDLSKLTWIPRIKNFAADSTYSDEEKRYDADAQAKAWLNMMFDKSKKDRTDFRRYLQWERDCLKHKFLSRGSGIAAYKNDPVINDALAHGGTADLIGQYCLDKALMHPLNAGMSAADNDATKRKYADLSNRMAYIADVKFNGRVPSMYLDNSDKVWFGWHNMPGGQRAFTKKRFGRDSDMFSKAPPKEDDGLGLDI